jgi:rare lipoprotein A
MGLQLYTSVSECPFQWTIMKQKVLVSLTAILAANACLLSAGKASQSQGVPTHEIQSTSQTLPDKQATVPASPTLEIPTAPTLEETKNQPAAEAISKVHAHQVSGRDAVTVYVKDIPVITFLGAKSTLGAGGEKVATTSKTIPLQNQSPLDLAIAQVSQDPIVRATALATKLNQLSQAGFDAKLVRVSWKPQKKLYVIDADKEVLVVLGKETVLPNSTGSSARDALKITNLMRRQLGNAPALVSIVGQPKPVWQPNSEWVSTGTVRFQITGEASWYGPGFHGARTANGESFNQYAMTAAHRTLPFGTQVRVTNLNNGRSVVVRINDRGPFSGGRVLDLSKGAASQLGVISSGVAPVRIDVLR